MINKYLQKQQNIDILSFAIQLYFPPFFNAIACTLFFQLMKKIVCNIYSVHNAHLIKTTLINKTGLDSEKFLSALNN